MNANAEAQGCPTTTYCCLAALLFKVSTLLPSQRWAVPASYWSAGAPSHSCLLLIGQWQLHPIPTGRLFIILCFLEPLPAAAAALGEGPLCSQLNTGQCRPLIGQRELRPAPSGLCMVSSSSDPPPLASHWSDAAPSLPPLFLIGQQQLRPTPVQPVIGQQQL